MYRINRSSRSSGAVIKQNLRRIPDGRGGRDVLEYLTFPNITETGFTEHLFTTRTGGVSRGIWSSLNLSFRRGDDPEHVRENYRRIASVLGCGPERIVCSDQTHTVNIRLATDKDGGKGVLREPDYQDIDGLITDTPGLALAASFADCVPLYFVDTEHRAIGLAHSGWRGTVKKMGACMLDAMGSAFGTRPEHVTAAIGPSICQSCYEVGEDVAEQFRRAFAGAEELCREICRSGYCEDHGRQIIRKGAAEGKYQLDLWLANLIVLIQAQVPQARIAVTDICTCHNPDYLFSHRASRGRRGNLSAFLMLKES